MSYKIELCYETELGFTHLNKVVNVSEDDWKDVIDNYISNNNNKAKKLSDKWKTNGETKCELHPTVYNVSEFNPLWFEIFKYVEWEL